jgi:hypothetical protein
VPLSTVLETNGDEEVFKMKKDLEDFKNELSKDFLTDKSKIRRLFNIFWLTEIVLKLGPKLIKTNQTISTFKKYYHSISDKIHTIIIYTISSLKNRVASTNTRKKKNSNRILTV